MGLFDFLFGGSKPQFEDPEPIGPQMPGVEAWDDMATAARVEWLAAELEQVKARLDKAGLRRNPEGGKVELRGIHAGRPIALTINDDCTAELIVKFINRRGHLNLGPPIPGISDRPPADEEFWTDDNDQVAPLVSRQVALYGDAKTIESRQAVWDGLPADARERVLAWMASGHGHHFVVARHQAFESHQLCGPQYQVPVVEAIMRGFGELLALAELFGQGDAPILPIGAGPNYTPERRTCSYCSTTFFVEASDTRCPACGANS